MTAVDVQVSPQFFGWVAGVRHRRSSSPARRSVRAEMKKTLDQLQEPLPLICNTGVNMVK